MKDLNLDQTQLSRLWGLSGGTVSKWLRDNNAPKWTLPAAEGLRRQSRAKKDELVPLFVCLKAEDVDTAIKFLSAIGAKVGKIESTD